MYRTWYHDHCLITEPVLIGERSTTSTRLRREGRGVTMKLCRPVEMNLAEVTGDRVSPAGRGGISTYRGRSEPRNDSVWFERRDRGHGSRQSYSTTLFHPISFEKNTVTRHVHPPTFIYRSRFLPANQTNDMEQGTVSTIPDNSVGKQKSIGISINPGIGMQAATEKLKDKWLRSVLREDATGWEIFMFGLAEAIGTAILVFIGCTGCLGSMSTPPDALQVSLTFGFAVLIAIQCIGHISGAHINPCITIASLILGRKSLPMSLFYIVCQCLGGLLGYALLKIITPDGLIYNTAPEDASTFCVTLINSHLSIGQAFLAEFVGTAILILFACGLWDYRNANNTDSVSVRFAFCITVLCLVLLPYTGCSVNPARTFGPAVWNNYWKNHWVYWVAPITGAITAAIFYRCVFEYKDDRDYTVNS